MQRIIFLDMDGVLCDFAAGVAGLFGKAGPKAGDPAQALHEFLGVPKGVMWGRVSEVGARLWENLEPLPWADELVGLARSAGEVMIASSPSLHPGSLAGKLTWLQRRFGRNFRDFIITPHKHLLAQPQHILIDDTLKHVSAFRAAGGQAVYFPSVENGQLAVGVNPLDEVRALLR